MEIATYINLAFFIGFLGIFVWVCGVKAWCSVAVVATIAGVGMSFFLFELSTRDLTDHLLLFSPFPWLL
jgi:hypothetical protein